jgi:predicted O-methyltransferase YrrM
MSLAVVAKSNPASPYEFTNAWFTPHEYDWRDLFDSLKPKQLLEVGCYEGQATTFMIDTASRYCDPTIVCVDTWEGSVDLPPEAMEGVEARFDRNTKAALGQSQRNVTFQKCRKHSFIALCDLAVTGKRFDFIYIDASHTAPDVLTDAALAFRLLNIGGVMIFDDYTWCMEPQGRQDPLNMPKFAIDTFVNMFMRKIKFTGFGAGRAQYAISKVAD